MNRISMTITKPFILGLKRQAECTTATPDPKRPRQEPTANLASDTSRSDLPSNSESSPPAINPTLVTTPLSFGTLPPAKQQDFMERYFKLQSDIKQGLAAVQKAQADASPPEVVLPMKTDLGKKVELYKKLTTFLNQMRHTASTGVAPVPPQLPVVSIPDSTNIPTAETNTSNPVPFPSEPIQPLPSIAPTEPQNQNSPTHTAPARESQLTEVTAQIYRPIHQHNNQGFVQEGISSQTAHPLAGGTTQSSVANDKNALPRPPLRRQWHGVFSSLSTNHAQETIIYVSIDFQPNAEP